jgi:hypothetical protein
VLFHFYGNLQCGSAEFYGSSRKIFGTSAANPFSRFFWRWLTSQLFSVLRAILRASATNGESAAATESEGNTKMAIKRKRKVARKQRHVHRRLIKVRLRRDRRTRKTYRAPRTLKQFFALPQRLQETWSRVPQAISYMRDNRASLGRASREIGLNPNTVKRLGRSALRRQKNGRFVAKPADDLLRVLVIPATKGKREIAIRGSRQASLLARYWAAVHKYVSTGDSSAIEKFRGKHITDASRKRIPLLTDLEEIDRQASAGELSFESLYV